MFINTLNTVLLIKININFIKNNKSSKDEKNIIPTEFSIVVNLT